MDTQYFLKKFEKHENPFCSLQRPLLKKFSIFIILIWPSITVHQNVLLFRPIFLFFPYFFRFFHYEWFYVRRCTQNFKKLGAKFNILHKRLIIKLHEKHKNYHWYLMRSLIKKLIFQQQRPEKKRLPNAFMKKCFKTLWRHENDHQNIVWLFLEKLYLKFCELLIFVMPKDE